MKFQLFIIAFNIILFAITTQSTSQYKEVFWNEQKNRWQVEFDINGKKSTYYFGNELDAISARNRLHKKIGPILQTARIISIPNKQTTEKSSQFIGVSWNKVNKKWIAQINIKNRGKRFGGCFDDEHEAAKRVNQLCGELGMTAKNPGISGIPNQQPKEKTSKYKGVYWERLSRIWYVQLKSKQRKIFGGYFDNENDAAQKVNQLCGKLGVTVKNYNISELPNQEVQGKENTSQYNGVHWSKQAKKWMVFLQLKNTTAKYGGRFHDELDAGKRVNQLCAEQGLSLKNPEIGQYQINSMYKKKHRNTKEFLGTNEVKNGRLNCS